MDPEELQQRLNRFKETLRRSGIKMTHQRMEVFREVARSGDHPDAETVFKGVRRRIPSVSLDTVYRTLWLLLDLGLITTLGPARDRVRFDGNASSHHHFVCTKCGMARDFCSEEFDQLRVPDTVKALGHVERTQVEFRGLCSRCIKQEKSNRSN
jgi:Fur family peroxide stress response transcriptional regulator